MKVTVIERLEQVHQHTKHIFEAHARAEPREQARLFLHLVCISFEAVHVLVTYEAVIETILGKYEALYPALSRYFPPWFLNAVYDMFGALVHLCRGHPRSLTKHLEYRTTFSDALYHTYTYLRRVSVTPDYVPPLERPATFPRTNIFMYHFDLHRRARHVRPLDLNLSFLAQELLEITWHPSRVLRFCVDETEARRFASFDNDTHTVE